MKSKSIVSRLQLLNDGRAHYLEFLRNLTPPSILLSFAFIVMHQLDFGRFDFDNWVPTVLFFFLFSGFLLAFYASSTLFYERCFSDLIAWRTDLFASLNTKGFKGRQRFFAKTAALWKEKKIEVLELVSVFFFFQICFPLVIVMAWRAALHH
jgi:hypothetical protein